MLHTILLVLADILHNFIVNAGSLHIFLVLADVSEDLVVLLQERHEQREQVDMRRIAVEQLVRLQNTDMLPITDLIDLDSCKLASAAEVAASAGGQAERGSPKKSPASSS